MQYLVLSCAKEATLCLTSSCDTPRSTINLTEKILDPLNGEEILKKIERVARVCYKSEEKIGEGTAEKMVRALVKSKHEAMLEHLLLHPIDFLNSHLDNLLWRRSLRYFQLQHSTAYALTILQIGKNRMYRTFTVRMCSRGS